MTKELALEKYTQTIERINTHIRLNKSVFDAHEKIVFDLIDAENELRDIVATDNEGVNNNNYKVTIIPNKQVTFDEEKILQALNISKDEAVSQGLITITERPPTISIKKNK